MDASETESPVLLILNFTGDASGAVSLNTGVTSDSSRNLPSLPVFAEMPGSFFRVTVTSLNGPPPVFVTVPESFTTDSENRLVLRKSTSRVLIVFFMIGHLYGRINGIYRSALCIVNSPSKREDPSPQVHEFTGHKHLAAAHQLSNVCAPAFG